MKQSEKIIKLIDCGENKYATFLVSFKITIKISNTQLTVCTMIY
jgi:hypothetical protein